MDVSSDNRAHVHFGSPTGRRKGGGSKVEIIMRIDGNTKEVTEPGFGLIFNFNKKKTRPFSGRMVETRPISL